MATSCGVSHVGDEECICRIRYQAWRRIVATDCTRGARLKELNLDCGVAVDAGSIELRARSALRTRVLAPSLAHLRSVAPGHPSSFAPLRPAARTSCDRILCTARCHIRFRINKIPSAIAPSIVPGLGTLPAFTVH